MYAGVLKTCGALLPGSKVSAVGSSYLQFREVPPRALNSTDSQSRSRTALNSLCRCDAVQESNGSAVCCPPLRDVQSNSSGFRYDGLMFHASGADEDGIFTLQVLLNCLPKNEKDLLRRVIRFSYSLSQARFPGILNTSIPKGIPSNNEENVAVSMSKVPRNMTSEH
jgi:hypothetical protein